VDQLVPTTPTRLRLSPVRLAVSTTLRCIKSATRAAPAVEAESLYNDLVEARRYQVPTQTHPYAETVTLISGSVGFGMDEKFDNKGALPKPRTLFVPPANTRTTFGPEMRRRSSKFSSSGRGH
jgi:hypothetical protein